MFDQQKIKIFPIVCSQKVAFSPFFTTYSDKPVKTVFFPGCALAGAEKRLSLKIQDAIRKIDKHCEILSGCCGKPSVFIKRTDLFEHNLSKLSQILKEKGVKELITACPNCHDVFTKHLADEELTVTFLWRYLLNNNHAILNKKSYNKLYEAGPIFLHDACATRSYPDIHESVRTVLEQVGISITEFKHCGKGTVCCGKTNMLHTTHPSKYLHLAGKRAEEANKAEGMIITYCQSCAGSFTDVGTHSLSLAEILFGGQEDLRPHNGISYWKNRFEIAIHARQD